MYKRFIIFNYISNFFHVATNNNIYYCKIITNIVIVILPLTKSQEKYFQPHVNLDIFEKLFSFVMLILKYLILKFNKISYTCCPYLRIINIFGKRKRFILMFNMSLFKNSYYYHFLLELRQNIFF